MVSDAFLFHSALFDAHRDSADATSIERQVIDLATLAANHEPFRRGPDDALIATQPRFAGRHPPGTWLVISPTEVDDPIDRLRAMTLPASFVAVGVVSWAVARFAGPHGIDECPAVVALVAHRRLGSLSVTCTSDRRVFWTPHPAGALAEAARSVLGADRATAERLQA